MRLNRNTFILVLFLLMAVDGIAQKNKGGLVLNAGAGFSAFGILGSISISIKDEFTINSKSTPAYVASLDYAIENKVSIGLAGGYQSVHQQISDYKYTDIHGVEKTGAFSYDLSRVNVGARILFHFGQGRMDAYAGIKPGVNIYELKVNLFEDIPQPNWLKVSGTSFAFQIIPIGFRGYISDNFGFFFETGIGAPSFISGGLSFGIQLPTETIYPTN